MKETVGFIGIGAMGKPMSLNLIKAGYPLVAYDVNVEPLALLREKGATIGESSADVAKRCDFVITMLPNSQNVEEAVMGARGALAPRFAAAAHGLPIATPLA